MTRQRVAHTTPTPARRKVVLLAFAVMLSLGLAAYGGAIAYGRPAAATTYVNPAFGYEVTLPASWRRSLELSLPARTSPQYLGHDVFTRRTEQDEQQQLAAYPRQIGPSWQFVAVVEVWTNPQGLTPVQWANNLLRAGWAQGQTIDAATLGGRPAARTTNGPRYSIAYYVADKGNMYLVGVKLDAPSASWQPQGFSRADLDSIPQSFRFVGP